MVSHQRSIHRIAASVLLGSCVASASGCALIPSWNDLHNGTKFVKDTVTGKAKRDKQNQMFAEARILERRQDYVSAEKLYRELLKERPNSRDCFHRLAVIASQQQKFDEATTLYRQALDCGDPTPDLWNDLGYCHYLQQQLPEAEGALQQALALQPKHRAALNNLAMVLGEQGNLEAAYALFRQAGTEAEAEANIAFLCAQLGEFPRAQYHYSRALSFDPTLRKAAEALIQVTRRMQLIEDRAVIQASATDPNQPGAVQQADGTEPIGTKSRRMIEVFTASTPRQSPSAARANSGESNSTNPPSSPSTLHQLSQASPIVGGAITGSVQPYSFPQQTQPQYLQPRFGPANGGNGAAAGNNGPGGNVGGMPTSNGQVLGGSTTNVPSNSGGVLNAGGPFPPLVGGATAFR